jgi:alkylation response protein AidB-like acyl-CoA dehydrogenase
MRRLQCVQDHLAPEAAGRCAGSAAPASDKGSMAETRAMEAKRCVWSVDVLESILDRETVELKRAAFRIVLADPVLQPTDMDQFEKTAPERREQSTRRLLRFAQLVKGKSEEEELHLIRAVSCVDSGTAIRWFVQRLLWIETIRNQGSAEQIDFWTNGAREYSIVGCFGMTELGSSSHLRGAETESIYDHATRSFRINSPTVTATKIWIGQAGQIATHCIVFANLRVDNKPCGIQLFVVQIRDQRTGLPMPGVEVGDMGPKVGLDGNDNGFLRFSNVVIPYSHMLCRWAKIEPDGQFVEAPLAALAYGSTIAERLVSYYMYDRLSLYSAVMWCLVRRQGME